MPAVAIVAFAVLATLAQPAQAVTPVAATLNVSFSAGSDNDAGTTAAGTPANLIATVNPTSGPILSNVEVDFEIEGGPNDVTGAGNDAGTTPSAPDFTCTVTAPISTATPCTGTYTPAFGNLDTIRAWIHTPGNDRATEPDGGEGVNESVQPGNTAEPDSTDVVSNLVTGGTGGTGGGAEVLDCNDESGDESATDPTTGSQAETNETYTCRVSVSGTGVLNVPVDGKVISGPNQTASGSTSDFTCTTTAAGTCTIDVPNSAPPLAAGTAIVCFWIDTNNDTAYNTTNAGDGSGCNEAVNAPERDNSTDTVQVVWQARVVTTIDILNEDDARVLPTQGTQTFNIKALDQFGGGIPGAHVDTYIVGGPNADSGSVIAASRTCTSAADGSCNVTYTANGKNGIDKLCAWLDSIAPTAPDQLYETGASAPENHGGKCATEPEAPGTDGGTALTDRGQVTWTGGTSGPAQLEVTPETIRTSKGDVRSLTATVKDENGNVLAGVKVDFELAGAGDPDSGDSPGSPDRSCTTGVSGTCNIDGTPGDLGSATGFTSSVDGRTTIRAWVDGTNADTAEGPDAGSAPDEPNGGTDQPGNTVEPDTTDVVTVDWGLLGSAIANFAVAPSSHIAVWGVKPVVSGVLTDNDTPSTPIANVTVSIYRRVGSAGLSPIGSTQTGSDGSFSFTDTSQPPQNCAYQAVYAGDANHTGVSSQVVAFYVRVGVIFNASPTTLPRNHATVISGYIAPSKPGKKVTLQFLNGAHGTWDNVRTVTLDSASKFRFSYTRNGSGGYLLFRISYATQDSLNAWNVSRNIKVTWT